jgi:3-oxoacyl-[acyl-carrier protein] reductase
MLCGRQFIHSCSMSTDRVAIITGGSRGIGFAIAQALSAEGCGVVLCARDGRALARAEVQIVRAAGEVLSISSDLTQPAAAKRVVARTLRHFGRVDILVNNVGGLCHPPDRTFLELTDRDWHDTFDLNLMTAVRACRAVIPPMRTQRSGWIINIASTAGLDGATQYPDYRIAKAGLIALGRVLATDLAPDGIRVNTVCPGPVWTPSWEREAARKAKFAGVPVDDMARAIQSGVAATIPLGRMGRVEDVARLVAFLVSPKSTWMTGAVLCVDGGGIRQTT